MAKKYKYEISWWLSRIYPTIEKVQIERETEKSIWIVRTGIESDRCIKSSSSRSYHDTWKEAHDKLMKIGNNSVEIAERNLRIRQDELKQVKEMEEF